MKDGNHWHGTLNSLDGNRFWGHNQALHSIDDDNHECCAVNCTGTVNKYKFKKYICM